MHFGILTRLAAQGTMEGAAGKQACYLRGGGSDAACGVQRGSAEQGVLPLLCSVLLIVW